ncbi:helix-turn-helix transcriptional regulator [Actinomadura sp. HBU206391]|uniref:helix-turn-helix transcriptional regulator n=1 Tax=Actinomadura sp. HBU206391 TaxID=2731692 RepID=UPI00164FEE78|nr:AAA family ATPase [Actinomadura sp. HBU206391]MBC6460102.1 AAA family ATPase [Actinomadura sp. HBU206391]
MSTSVVSPVFVGRKNELTVLTDVYAAVGRGTPATVLLGGEAGVGKTRLVNEFVAQVTRTGEREVGRVLLGGCLELSSAGLPYAPFTAMLRQLVRDIGLDEIAALMPGGTARDLARLLPGFGETPSDPDPETGRVRLFEQMLTLLERLAERAPLVLVVEDAHWADRSTRDLLTFLIRNLRHGTVLLLVTYRSDDLHRTHPLRPMLAELNRVEGVVGLDLPRLGRSEVATQLSGILGRPAEPSLVEAVYGRSVGIPLFVEATAGCADDPQSGVPASLRDLLLAGVQRLPEDAQELLRTASAGGVRVGHELLAAVSGLDDRELTAALRPAVDGNVLVAGADGYTFRHALIREAIHEDLLPGERSRTHRRFAEVIETAPGIAGTRDSTVALAQHWYAAHDNERALIAAWRAAGDLAVAVAYAEQVEMLGRVLELWDRVPNAAELVDSDQVGVLMLAAEAATACGEVERGLAMVRAALAEIDEERDPERFALALASRARLRGYKGMLPEQLQDLRRAERLASGATPARATVLARLISALLLRGLDEECEAFSAESLSLARRLGDRAVAVDAIVTLATIAAGEGGGDIEENLQDLREARAEAERLGSGLLVLRSLINISHMLESAGRHDLAIEAAREGFELAQRIGRARIQGPFLAGNLAESLISAGRWTEADRVLEKGLELDPAYSLSGYLLVAAGTLALARGDLAGLADVMRAMPTSFTADHAIPQDGLPYTRLLIDWRLAEGDLNAALDRVHHAVSTLDLTVRPRFAWPVLVSAMRACAEVATDADTVRDDTLLVRATVLRTALRDLADRLPARGRAMAAYATTFAAESARAAGMLDRTAWDAAAGAWEDLGSPYPYACALLRAAEGAAGDGDRDGASGRLRRAAEVADRLGAVPLRGQIDHLARRARISLGDGPPPADESAGLTPREREVLRLVAEGRSNRQIADALFISAKTASVHVSNILGKLGVAGRGEAAAVAHRLQLFD